MTQIIDGKYRIVRQLGAGGMGAVYEAEHTGVGRRVALKVIHHGLLEKDPTMTSRLPREARLAGSLDSPHIAQVFDTGVDGGTGSPYLVMEYLAGEDLQSLLLRVGTLPVPLALRILGQATLGLRKAHDARVIHRDIKPANLFLARRDGEIVVKLLDFGVAKVRFDELGSPSAASLTRTGSLIGSPLFMSPEQARGMKTLDERTDLWSLGVVLFSALTGRTPYEEIDALGELILAICSTVSPSVRDYAPDVPMSVAELVQRSLSLAIDLRFQTAQQLSEAIVAELVKQAGSDALRITEAEVDGLAPRDDAPPRSFRPRVMSDAPPGAEQEPRVSRSAGGTLVVHSTPSRSDAPLTAGSSSPGKGHTSVNPNATSDSTSMAQSASRTVSHEPPAHAATVNAVVKSTAPSAFTRTSWIVGASAALTLGGLGAWFLTRSPAPDPALGSPAAGVGKMAEPEHTAAPGEPAPSVADVGSVAPLPTTLLPTTSLPTDAPSAVASEHDAGAPAVRPPASVATGAKTAPTATTPPKPTTSPTASQKAVDTSAFGDRK